MKKKNSKSGNPLNIKQTTYELIPKIKELSKTMSQKEVQEKLRINKKTLKKIKDAENINFRTTYLPFGIAPKKSIPYAERYTAKEKSEMYQKRKSNETEDDPPPSPYPPARATPKNDSSGLNQSLTPSQSIPPPPRPPPPSLPHPSSASPTTPSPPTP